MVVGALKCFLCWSRVRELVLKSVDTQDLQREGLCLTIKTLWYLLSVFCRMLLYVEVGGGVSDLRSTFMLCLPSESYRNIDELPDQSSVI